MRKYGIRNVSSTPEYTAWMNIRMRCKNPQNPEFPNYGGRGIRICPAWDQDFLSFLGEVGQRPGPRFSIDRIDNEGDYEPGNVRWATIKQQLANTRRAHRIEFRGEIKTIKGWAEALGFNHRTLYQRFEYGWSIAAMLTTPPLHAAHQGKRHTATLSKTTQRS